MSSAHYIRPTIYTLAAMAIGVLDGSAIGAPIQQIAIDGSFADWDAVPTYFDPADDETQDWHGDPPAPLAIHPDVDILEYKFTHDENNLYAYFRAQGQVGRTQRAADGNGPAGRFYVIVTIDVDDNNTTGYELSEGGYYPSSNGYDMNMEIEYYDGAFNTGHYINHGAPSDSDEDLAPLIAQQNQGIVDVLPGSYDGYTQWVMFDDSTSGDHDLNDGTSITHVSDKGPVFQGIIEAAISLDGSKLEMVAPFVGFMSYPGAQPGQRGDPIMALGRTIDISFSLESSPELFDNGEWASDTAAPINSYFLGAYQPPGNIIDDFEANEGHFGWAYDNSPSQTFGLSASTTIDRVTTVHQGVGVGSQLLNLVIDASAPDTWQLRHNSGIGSPAIPASNTALEATGYVGFWLKTDEAGTSVRIGIDDPGGTGAAALELGYSQPVIADNEWHLYQWNLEEANHWNAFSGGANGQIDAVNGTITIDSIFFNGASSAQVYLDSVSHNPLGMLAATFVPGDYNGDGVVNSGDYNAWRKSFGDSVAIGSKADGNYNGVIDVGDYILWRKQLSAGSGAAAADGAAAIPEPATALLVGLGLVAVLAGRWRPARARFMSPYGIFVD